MQRRTPDSLVDDLIDEMLLNMQLILSLAHRSKRDKESDITILLSHYSDRAALLRHNFPISKRKIGYLAKTFLEIRSRYISTAYRMLEAAELTSVPQRQYFE
jgi:hypothetical protein